MIFVLKKKGEWEVWGFVCFLNFNSWNQLPQTWAFSCIRVSIPLSPMTVGYKYLWSFTSQSKKLLLYLVTHGLCLLLSVLDYSSRLQFGFLISGFTPYFHIQPPLYILHVDAREVIQ